MSGTKQKKRPPAEQISAILGISPDSVKKTKARLKKRLELAEDVDLDGFVLAF